MKSHSPKEIPSHFSLAALAGLSVLLSWCWAAPIAETATSPLRVATSAEVSKTLISDGRKRSYLLHVPPAYDGKHPIPLVIVLHGHGGSATRVLRISGLAKKADEEGFLIAAPNGTSWLGFSQRSWNAGYCCGYAMGKQVDDVEFIRRLIDTIRHDYQIDLRRIYITGVSNGGMMAYRLACDMSDVIAAIAPVSGTYHDETCAPLEPVSVVAFHGTDDNYVLYRGGPSPRSRTGRVDPPVSRTVSFWVRHNRCRVDATRNMSENVISERCGSGRHEAAVALYTIKGGGHAWPGGRWGWRFGVVPSDLPSTDIIWEFFEAHPKL